MESKDAGVTPDAAAAALRDADAARANLVDHVRVPPGAHVWLGGAVAVQIASAAIGFGLANRWMLPVILAGVAVFGVVAAVQVLRFRRLNGVALGGYTSKVILGSGVRPSVAYAAGLAVSFAAAMAQRWWLVAIAAALGGLGYALSGQQWMSAYRRDPARMAPGQSRLWQLAIGGLAVVALILLVAAR